MPRKIKTQKRKPSPDALLKTGKKGEIELTEKDLKKVSGGEAVAGGTLDKKVTIKWSTS